jgi:hypothetical protein
MWCEAGWAEQAAKRAWLLRYVAVLVVAGVILAQALVVWNVRDGRANSKTVKKPG